MKLLLVCMEVAIALSLTCMAQSSSELTAPARIHIEDRTPAPDRMLDMPPLPKGQVSLIGGTVARIDPIRDRMVVRAFGGRDITIDFDVRTAVLRGTTPASSRDLRPGTRVYADTILKDGRTFAKTVRIAGNASSGETRGQVISYDPSKKLLKVRDIISSQPFSLRLNAVTEVRSNGQPVQPGELITGTLVHVVFRSGFEGANSAQKIDILARPGSTFTFSGRILVVDLRDDHLTLAENASETTFEVGLDSLTSDAKLRLKEGMEVLVQARFDGNKYEAQSVEPLPSSNLSTPQ